MRQNVSLFLLLMVSLLPGQRVLGASYGDAGCGLGSLFIEKNTVVMQVLAYTVNQAFGQPLSMTTGTSNCSRDGIVQADREAEYFAEAHFDRIVDDVAMGDGEFWTAFSQTLGCGNQAKDKLSDTIRPQLGSWMEGNWGPRYWVMSVKNLIQANPELARECNPWG